MSEPVSLYRLHTARRNGNASTGNVEHYESRERFEEDLLLALIEATAADTDYRRSRLTWRGCRAWLEHVLKRDGGWQAERVVAAQHLVDGQWVDLAPVLVPPHVVFGGLDRG
jgi:hypothetical protein